MDTHRFNTIFRIAEKLMFSIWFIKSVTGQVKWITSAGHFDPLNFESRRPLTQATNEERALLNAAISRHGLRYDATAETATITWRLPTVRATIQAEAIKCVWHNMPYGLF
jgi:hypothetical protein